MASNLPSVSDSALDLARLREEFPVIVKTWDQMNIRERAEFKTAQARAAAGLK